MLLPGTRSGNCWENFLPASSRLSRIMSAVYRPLPAAVVLSVLVTFLVGSFLSAMVTWKVRRGVKPLPRSGLTQLNFAVSFSLFTISMVGCSR